MEAAAQSLLDDEASLDAVRRSEGSKADVPVITLSTIEQAADIAAVRYDRSGDHSFSYKTIHSAYHD